ncbi:hypothetical protein [Cupriavidus necator]
MVKPWAGRILVGQAEHAGSTEVTGAASVCWDARCRPQGRSRIAQFLKKLRYPLLAICIALMAGWIVPCTAQVAVAEADAHWARVLRAHVNERGQVDFCGIANDPADLRIYLDYIARVSPQSMPAAFPTRNDALAYYINSYNALAMYNIIVSGMPKELGWLTRMRFFLCQALCDRWQGDDALHL